VDAEKGLVLASRAIIPYDLCDVSLTFADSIIVDAKVLFMHPLQNYCIVQYDPSLVQAPVKTPTFATEPIKQGEETVFFGFNQNLRPVVGIKIAVALSIFRCVTVETADHARKNAELLSSVITYDADLGAHFGKVGP